MAVTPFITDAEATQKIQLAFLELNNEISALAGGFRGSIEITDTPTEIGYYLPSESGTYTNAGSIVVDLTAGLTILAYNGTTWTDVVIPIDFPISQETGNEEGLVMSQKAITDIFHQKEVAKSILGDIYKNVWAIFDGSSSIPLSNPITLENEGDFVEFTVVCDDFGITSAATGMGIMGQTGAATSNIGIWPTGLLYIRNSAGTWLSTNGFLSAITAGEEFTIRLEWNESNVSTFKNGVFQKNITLGTVIINTIGNAYHVSPNNFKGRVRNITINSTPLNLIFLNDQNNISFSLDQQGYLSEDQQAIIEDLIISSEKASFIFKEIKPNIWSVYDGNYSQTTISDVVLSDEGDFIEFTTLPTTFGSTSSDRYGMGMAGENGLSTSHIGIFDTGQLFVRNEAGTWLTTTGFLSPSSENNQVKIKLVWTDTNIDVYRDDIFQKSITKGTLKINNFGNAYGGVSYKGNLKRVTLKSGETTYNIGSPYFYGTNTEVTYKLSNQGFFTDLQKQQLQEAGVSNLSNEYYEFNPTGNAGQHQFIIYTKIYGNFYAGFRVARQLDLSESVYSDNYRIYDGYLYQMSDGAMVNQSLALLDGGESEFVYRADGASDHTGGVHGDETFSEIDFFASGVKLDLSEAIPLSPCSGFYYSQISNMHTTDDVAHPVEAVHHKITKFEKGGYNTFNRLIWQINRTLTHLYHGVSCIAKDTASNGHNEYLETETFVGDGVSNKLSRVGVNKFFAENQTNKLSAYVESELLKPAAENDTCTMFIWDREGDSKYYRRLLGYNGVAGDVWESEMTVRFNKL